MGNGKNKTFSGDGVFQKYREKEDADNAKWTTLFNKTAPEEASSGVAALEYQAERVTELYRALIELYTLLKRPHTTGWEDAESRWETGEYGELQDEIEKAREENRQKGLAPGRQARAWALLVDAENTLKELAARENSARLRARMKELMTQKAQLEAKLTESPLVTDRMPPCCVDDDGDPEYYRVSNYNFDLYIAQKTAKESLLVIYPELETLVLACSGQQQ